MFQLEGFKAFKFFIHIEIKMNSDRKKTLIAIDSSYVIKKRRKRLLEKEKNEIINIGFLQTVLSLYQILFYHKNTENSEQFY